MSRIDPMETVHRPNDQQACIFCPACHRVHTLRVSGPKSWDFNGDLVLPTFSPSLLCEYKTPDGTERCHSYIRGGRMQYLTDCTHDLAGQTVELPPFKWHD